MYKNYTYMFTNPLIEEGLDDRTNHVIVGELPLTNVSFTKQLNSVGTFTGELLISGVNTTALNVFDSTSPAKRGLIVMENGSPIWGGIIWDRSYSSDSQKIIVTAKEFLSYLDRRKVIWKMDINDVTTSPISGGTRITYENRTALPSPFIVGQTVTITGVNPSAFNITGAIVAASAFSFDIDVTPAITATYVASPQFATVTSCSASGGVLTYVASNSFKSGQVVKIVNASNEIFNTTGVITAANAVSFALSTNFTGSASATTADAYTLRGTAIAAEAVFTNAEQFDVVNSMLKLTKSLPNGDIKIIAYTGSPSGVEVSKTYYSYEMKTVLSAITDLSQSGNGFDFDLNLYNVNVGGVDFTFKELALYYPRKGNIYSHTSTNEAVPVFEFPAGNVVSYEYPEDGIITANTFYAVGAGSNEGQLIATSVNTDAVSTDTDYPILEEAGNYSDIEDWALLSQISASAVAAVSYPPVVIKMVISGSVGVDYSTGDDARVRIIDSRFPTGLDAIYRIIAVTIQPGEDGPERITVTLANPTGVAI